MACAASPEQQHLPADVPGGDVHGAELPLRMAREFLQQVRHERRGVREFTPEEGVDRRRRARGSRSLPRPVRARNSVAVKLPSVLGSAISMKPPRGQMCSAFALQGVCCAVTAGSVSSL